MRILSSLDVTITVANFTCNVKSSLVKEAHITELVSVTGYPTENVGSEVICGGSAASEILAVYTLHCGLLNKEFTVHGLLTKCTSTDLAGSFPNGFDFFRCHLRT